MKRAIVVASAPGWDDELSQWESRCVKTWDLLAVNFAGVKLERDIAGWGSVHGNDLALQWIPVRESRGGNLDCPIFADSFLPGQSRDVIQHYKVQWPGSSALYVVQWALDVAKYDRIVLAGVHLTGQTRDRETVVAAPNNYRVYRDGWRDALPEIVHRVHSLGGWTRELLDEPPEHWTRWT